MEVHRTGFPTLAGTIGTASHRLPIASEQLIDEYGYSYLNLQILFDPRQVGAEVTHVRDDVPSTQAGLAASASGSYVDSWPDPWRRMARPHGGRRCHMWPIAAVGLRSPLDRIDCG